jgi:hypothetical protein
MSRVRQLELILRWFVRRAGRRIESPSLAD